MENDKFLEHENKYLADHLAKVWEYLQPRRKELGDVTQRLGMMSVQGIPAPLSSMSSTVAMAADISKTPDLLRQFETMDKKSTMLENIVCVLNREVERSSTAMEETMRQRRADQEKIDTLNAKVSYPQKQTMAVHGCKPEASECSHTATSLHLCQSDVRDQDGFFASGSVPIH